MIFFEILLKICHSPTSVLSFTYSAVAKYITNYYYYKHLLVWEFKHTRFAYFKKKKYNLQEFILGWQSKYCYFVACSTNLTKPWFWANAFLTLAHLTRSSATLWNSLLPVNLTLSSSHFTFCFPGLWLPLGCQQVIFFDHRLSFSLHGCPAQSHFSLLTACYAFLFSLYFLFIWEILTLSSSLRPSIDLSMEFCADWIFFSTFLFRVYVWHLYVSAGVTQLLNIRLL